VKILLVHNFYRQPGGEDVVMEAEAGMLRRAGHEVLTYLRDNHEINSGGLIQAASLAINTVWARDTYRDLKSILEQERPDVAHFHNTFPQVSPAGYDACRDARVPVIQTLHNYRLLCPAATFYRENAYCDRCLTGSLVNSVIHGCYRGSRPATAVTAAMLGIHRLRKTWSERVDQFIALTEYGRQMFIRGGLPARKVIVKPNFVANDPGAKLGRGAYAAFVGRLSPDKGLRTLIAAWKLLPDIPLVIAGDGPIRAELEAEVSRAGLNQVTFKGHLRKPETLATIHGARFLVFPSEWPEGFPMTIAESFACGVPVLSSDIGGLPEIVNSGRTGLLFRTGDPTHLAQTALRAWNNIEATAALGRDARAEYLSLYTAERNYRQLMDIYEHTIRRTRGIPAIRKSRAASA
jgi:glycosyltransferase involved in cell wall biosynthesis